MAPIKKIQVGPKAPDPGPPAKAGQKSAPTPANPRETPTLTGQG